MRTLILPLLLLAGCNTFDFLSPTSVQGVVVGVEAQAGGTTLGDGPVLAAVYLAQATSIQDFSSNLISDPDSIELSDGNATAPLEAADAGLWVTGEEALTSLIWESGATLSLDLVEDGDDYSGWAVAPQAPVIQGIPEAIQLDELPTDWSGMTEAELAQIVQQQADAAQFHPVGGSLTVDLSGSDFEYWVVVVVDQDGNVTFDNRPVGAQDLIDWVLEAEPIDSFEIPGSAFPSSNSLYAVGVAGVEFAPTKNYDGFNWLISNFGAGTLTVAPLITGQ